jgi:hypothetical protein
MSDRRAWRFYQRIDGVEWHGVAFTSEAALEEFLRRLGLALDDVSPSPARTVPPDLDVVGGIGTPAADARQRRPHAIPSSVTAEAKAGSANAEPEKTPRRRGRPSKSAIIAKAVKLLGPTLDRLPSQAARARAVQKMIAKIADAETVPAIHTVELWLAEHPQKILTAQPKERV